MGCLVSLNGLETRGSRSPSQPPHFSPTSHSPFRDLSAQRLRLWTHPYRTTPCAIHELPATSGPPHPMKKPTGTSSRARRPREGSRSKKAVLDPTEGSSQRRRHRRERSMPGSAPALHSRRRRQPRQRSKPARGDQRILPGRGQSNGPGNPRPPLPRPRCRASSSGRWSRRPTAPAR